MFNLTVDTAHTFYVGENGWLVHNCGPRGMVNLFGKEGQGFTGVYDSVTGNIGLAPSVIAPSADQIAAGFVRQYGGHAVVSRQLGGAAADHLGFAVISDAEGGLIVRWRSATLNSAYENNAIPVSMRASVIKSIEEQTGRKVSQW